MKNIEKGSRRWDNPPPGPGLSIADEILAKGKDTDGLLARIAHDVKREREGTDRQFAEPRFVPRAPPRPKQDLSWVPKAMYDEKRSDRDRGRKPWQKRRN